MNSDTEMNVRAFFKTLTKEELEKTVYFKDMDFDTVSMLEIMHGIELLNKSIKDLMANDNDPEKHEEVFNTITSRQNMFTKIVGNPYVSYYLMSYKLAQAQNAINGNN